MSALLLGTSLITLIFSNLYEYLEPILSPQEQKSSQVSQLTFLDRSFLSLQCDSDTCDAIRQKLKLDKLKSNNLEGPFKVEAVLGLQCSNATCWFVRPPLSGRANSEKLVVIEKHGTVVSYHKLPNGVSMASLQLALIDEPADVVTLKKIQYKFFPLESIESELSIVIGTHGEVRGIHESPSRSPSSSGELTNNDEAEADSPPE